VPANSRWDLIQDLKGQGAGMADFKSLSYFSHHPSRKSVNGQDILGTVCSQPPYTSVTTFPIGNRTKSSINILQFIKLEQQ